MNEATKAISSGQFNPGTISINLPISEDAGLKQVTINEVVEVCKQSWAEQVEEGEGAFIPVKPKNKQSNRKQQQKPYPTRARGGLALRK